MHCTALLRRLACAASASAFLFLLAGAGAAAAPAPMHADGLPAGSALRALSLLQQAADEGLDPEDYGATALSAAAARLGGRAPAEDSDLAVRIDAALRRYLGHVQLGRVDPRAVGFRLPAARRADTVDAVLEAAAADGDLDMALARLRPPHAQYEALRAALAHYRRLAADPSLAAPLAMPAATLRPGEPAAGLAGLAARLEAYGDLAGGPAPHAAYDAALVEAVRRFQRRHGLVPDGVLGPATRAALQVPPARRARQIALAMERLRWLPDLRGERVIGINIPMFRLWAGQPGRPGPLSTDVIVGRALDTRTPVFAAEMRQVVFRPWWNVPRSIAVRELLPRYERDPGALRRDDMELVRGPGDDAPSVAATPANLALLRSGALRLRQRPGPRNALGLVKFVFPNDAAVYLHGTPAPQLFERARRDLSHGCVRVADPVALAEWVLSEQPGWPRERIEAAMAQGAPRTVALQRPLPVLLYYLTAMVVPGSAELHFSEDLYGHDARLERALAAARR